MINYSSVNCGIVLMLTLHILIVCLKEIILCGEMTDVKRKSLTSLAGQSVM